MSGEQIFELLEAMDRYDNNLPAVPLDQVTVNPDAFLMERRSEFRRLRARRRFNRLMKPGLMCEACLHGKHCGGSCSCICAALKTSQVLAGAV